MSRQAFDRQRTELSVADGEVTQTGQQLRLVEMGPRVERIAAQRAQTEQANAAIARIDALLSQIGVDLARLGAHHRSSSRTR